MSGPTEIPSDRFSRFLPDLEPIAADAEAPPTVGFRVRRARDLLVLDVEARGMRLATGGASGSEREQHLFAISG